jgi:hypothetical protein
VPRDNCRAFAMRHNWDESARLFLANIGEAMDLSLRVPRADVTTAGEHSSVAA